MYMVQLTFGKQATALSKALDSFSISAAMIYVPQSACHSRKAGLMEDDFSS
jgi:hypothetical protein